MCVSVCVCERERERVHERETKKSRVKEKLTGHIQMGREALPQNSGMFC